jgi:RNA polymerase sigma factor (TIGR02999 family)
MSTSPISSSSSLPDRDGDVTRFLDLASHGDLEALGRAFVALRGQLHSAASSAMRRHSKEDTLQPTALMNEAYIKAAESCATRSEDHGTKWTDRQHFIKAQVETMKNLLVDSARRRSALRRGGGTVQAILSEHGLDPATPVDDTLFINDACEELAKRHPQAAELAELHYFGNFTWSEAAALMGLSDRQRKALRKLADAWFAVQLAESDEPNH